MMDSRTPSDLETTGTLPLQGDGMPASIEPTPEPDAAVPGWDGGKQQVVAVQREWTRIGRSLAADVRFDDATVSRRHALIVHQADGTRVLDDRSLNGVYVNGRRVEWSPLKDGDQVVVGRHTLFFLDTATVGSPVPEVAAKAE
jgi:pSer/pThr/pTyr-binding forkhead associated (FHA) protein